MISLREPTPRTAWPSRARCRSNRFGLDRRDRWRARCADDRRRTASTTPTSYFQYTAQRGLEPGGRHRQERQLPHRPGRRRARGGGREDRLRVLRRHLRGRAARRRAAPCARSPRPGRAATSRSAARRRSLAQPVLYAPMDPIATLDSTQKVALLEKVEKLRPRQDPRIVQVMAGLAGEYDVVLVARADGTLRRRRAPAGAPVGHRDRRADDRPARCAARSARAAAAGASAWAISTTA